MIDSLNLIIRIKYIEIELLKSLNINMNYFSNEDYVFRFSYKNIEFKYNHMHKYLLLVTHPNIILNKDYITLSDKEIYKDKVYKILKEILPNQKIGIEINRIDYYVDIPVGTKIEEYCTLLNRHNSRYHYMRQKSAYETSKYLTNKKGQTHLNFYNRYAKTRNVRDLGILRLEVQIYSPKIKTEYRKNFLNTPTIDYYWSKRAMEKYFFEFLRPYLYNGDYYKREKCKKIIYNENSLKKQEKKAINKLTLMEERYGLDGLIRYKVFSVGTLKKYIDKLNNIDINPIMIPKSLKSEHLSNLLKLSLKIAEEKYFK